MKIRKARKEDLEQLKNIYESVGIEEYKTQYPDELNQEITKKINHWSTGIFSNFHKEIESKRFYWILAEDNKKIIGFATAKIENGKEGWLNRNYIIKEYRKKGIGKEFTKRRIKWLKDNNIEIIYSKVFSNNLISKNNLGSFGFKPVEIKFEKKLK